MKTAIAALIAITSLAACTTTVSDNILFSAPPLGALISESLKDIPDEDLSALDTAKATGIPLTPEQEDLDEILTLFGPDQKHEGNTSLLYGYALEQATDLELSVSANRESVARIRRAEDFIPAQIEHKTLKAPYGALDTVYIEATELETSRRARPLIVHCYGNGANLYNTATFTAIDLLPYGDVFQFEYPGFTAGTEHQALRTIDNFNPMTDALAADLNGQNIDRPLIFWGHSLGGLVCANLAAKVSQADGLILETTGNDGEAIARAVVPLYAKPFIRLNVDERFSTFRISDMLAGSTIPVLVFGAKKDQTLSVGLSRRLHSTLTEAGYDSQYIELPNANHLSVKAQPELPDILNRFLNEIAPEG